MKTYMKPEVECVEFTTEEITLDPLDDSGNPDASTGVGKPTGPTLPPVNPFG